MKIICILYNKITHLLKVQRLRGVDNVDHPFKASLTSFETKKNRLKSSKIQQSFYVETRSNCCQISCTVQKTKPKQTKSVHFTTTPIIKATNKTCHPLCARQAARQPRQQQIGRASCRERVCMLV